MKRLVVAGMSTRAAAESAARAGYDVTSLDAYGDLDQHPAVRVVSLPRDAGVPFTPRAAAHASRSLEADAVAYLSSFENHPRAVQTLANDRALWGNPPGVLRRVRDPFLLADVLRRRGFSIPAILTTTPNRGGRFLVKPLRSGGGHRVRQWTARARVPRGHYIQELIDGTPGSIVFVAAGGRAVPLGISRQLIGAPAFGSSGYRYCGNILEPASGSGVDRVFATASELAQAVSEEFQLVGVNGIDFIARDGVPYPIEVNPRWSSSMELVEHADGVSVFGAHAAACTHGGLPAFDLVSARRGQRPYGKAIVFAREDSIAGDTRSWLHDPGVRDVPHPGERIAAGQPICTVFATADDVRGCEAALASQAARIYAEIIVKTLEPDSTTK